MDRVQIAFDGPVLFTHELSVRVTDLNYGNHLAHDTLVSLLHEARAQFFRSHGLHEAGTGGVGILLVDLAVRYLAQSYFGQVLRIEIAAGEVRSRGCSLVYRVTETESGTEVALAKTGIVFFDYGAGKVAPMPEGFRRMLTGGSKG